MRLRVDRFFALFGPLLACGDPPGAPGATSTTAETTAASSEAASETTDADTRAASSGSDTTDGGPDSGSGDAGADSDDTTAADTDTTAAPTPGQCGDGVQDAGEECDLGLAGNADDGACLVICKLATCGDGHVRAELEECDDQNLDPGDGCHQCGRTRIVFITSDFYQPKQFMGLAGADQRCRSLAAQAGLANFAGFMAWMSDSRISARDRMYHGKGRYELVNGLVVADDWNALVAGELQNPIVVTETSETSSTVVWTGTRADGSAAADSDHCLDWTYTGVDLEHTAYVGAASEVTANWSLIDDDLNPSQCLGESPIYCFEQE